MKLSYKENLRRPFSTEKLAKLQGEGMDPKAAGEGEWYGFEVDPRANKLDIKKAVEEQFAAQKIRVKKVRTMNCRGRASRMGQNESRTRYWKKALVQLEKGQSLNPS